jgi:hypothetical protein
MNHACHYQEVSVARGIYGHIFFQSLAQSLEAMRRFISSQAKERGTPSNFNSNIALVIFNMLLLRKAWKDEIREEYSKYHSE